MRSVNLGHSSKETSVLENALVPDGVVKRRRLMDEFRSRRKDRLVLGKRLYTETLAAIQNVSDAKGLERVDGRH